MKILFTSPFCLFDTFNGAASSVREMLRSLQSQGNQCEILIGSFSPDLVARSDESNRMQTGVHKEIDGIPVLAMEWEGIGCDLLEPGKEWGEFLIAHEVALSQLIQFKLDVDPPDIMLVTGRAAFLSKALLLAKEKKIPVIYYLNTVRKDIDQQLLRQVKRIIVPSHFLARKCQSNYQVETDVIHPIISDDIITRRNGAQFISMVNPAPEKGITLFYALAKLAMSKLPAAKFLLVEGRWTYQAACELGIPLHELTNLTVMPNQNDVRNVYARSKILLFPSYWEETFGRVVSEAQANGIPVVSSNQGGIPEALNGGGFSLQLPEKVRKNNRALPHNADIKLWFEILSRLNSDDRFRQQSIRRAHRASSLSNEEMHIRLGIVFKRAFEEN